MISTREYPDDSRFALVTAPATLPPLHSSHERYCTGAAPSVPVCLSQDAVVHSGVSQGDLGQDQGAGLSVGSCVQRGHAAVHGAS